MSIAPAHFTYLRDLVQKHSGIVIDVDKDYLVDGRLGSMLSDEVIPTIDALMEKLRSQPFGPVHCKVVEAMTNNESWFFRDFQPFDALKQKIIPELIEKNSSERKISLWSAASSFGQEPYSLAMCLREDFQLQSWRVSILATDLAAHALARARSGRYSQMEVSRGLPTPLLTKYFRTSGVDWELSPEILRMVEFQQMNLIGSWPYIAPVDILMLRNVLIYFDVETKKEILKKVKSVLRPGGVMFMGAAETTLNLDDGFERVPFGRSAYYQLRN
jgi:chemotaxis protein methyltransferase CheR